MKIFSKSGLPAAIACLLLQSFSTVCEMKGDGMEGIVSDRISTYGIQEEQVDTLTCAIRFLQKEIIQLQLELDAAGARSSEDYYPGTPSTFRSYQTVQREVIDKQKLLRAWIRDSRKEIHDAFDEVLTKLDSLEPQITIHANADEIMEQSSQFELLFHQDIVLHMGGGYPLFDNTLVNAVDEASDDYGLLQKGCKDLDVRSLEEWLHELQYFIPYYRFVKVKAYDYGDYLLLVASFDSIGETYNDYYSRNLYLKKVQPTKKPDQK